jgi:hypothetical protein
VRLAAEGVQMTGLYVRKPGDPTSQSNAEATLPEGRGHDVHDSKRFD